MDPKIKLNDQLINVIRKTLKNDGFITESPFLN